MLSICVTSGLPRGVNEVGTTSGQTGCPEKSVRNYNSNVRKTLQQPDLNMLLIYLHFTKERCSNKI
jgi:hypothetical protein